jgi:hypothetical protein
MPRMPHGPVLRRCRRKPGLEFRDFLALVVNSLDQHSRAPLFSKMREV